MPDSSRSDGFVRPATGYPGGVSESRGLSSLHAVDDAYLTIGDLSDRVGVHAATLRMWETRYGFPRPDRLVSGHRRYRETDVAQVREVVRLRDQGVRLDAAIDQVLATPQQPPQTRRDGPGPAPSVFARLRREHPAAHPQRLHKSTLLGLSWAIEDELCSRASGGYVFGAFQDHRFYEASRARWESLAMLAEAFAIADFGEVDDSSTGPGTPHLVSLDPGHPMRREWVVVCDVPDLPVALVAWELPGQKGVRDRERSFEAIWTIDPAVVRFAAAVCADVAASSGCEAGATARATLEARPPTARDVDPAAVSSVMTRVLTFGDRSWRR